MTRPHQFRAHQRNAKSLMQNLRWKEENARRVEEHEHRVAAERLHRRTKKSPPLLALTIVRAMLAATIRYDDPWEVMHTIETLCGLPTGAIASGARYDRIRIAREISAYVMRKALRMSYPQIALVLTGNGTNHNTTLSACRRAEKWISANEQPRGSESDGSGEQSVRKAECGSGDVAA
jgi:chromosomal replication initiation ATPase DnaA